MTNYERMEKGLPFYDDFDYIGKKGCVLQFPKEWVGTKLPDKWYHPLVKLEKGKDQTRHFQVELADTENSNKIYICHEWQSYDVGYYDGFVCTNLYLFSCHFCACHRKSAIEDQVETDGECKGRRFLIHSITAPKHMPGLVLYSETMTDEQLGEPKT